MWETVMVILAVVLAAAGIGYGLYRSASGKSGCAGCPGCGQTGNPQTAGRPPGACHAERK